MDKIKEVMGLVARYGAAVSEVDQAAIVKEYLAIESKLRELLEREEEARTDSCLLSFIQTECLDVRCVALGDDSYGWEVIQHHEGKTPEVKVGESFREDGLREALEDAVGAITN